ncbi:MAG TPA: inositol oxygenase family protein [Acidimicrobiales bacterium]
MASFPSMDVSTREQWSEIIERTIEAQPRVARQILAMVKGLSDISDGFSVDQMQHALQTATRAERDGQDEQVIVASLLHDVGKLISVPNHPRIAAEILKPYVRHDVYCMVTFHQDFQGRYYYEHLGMDPNLREQHRGEPWYDLAERFADQYDQKAFDPQYDAESLEHFEPMLVNVFAQAHSI